MADLEGAEPAPLPPPWATDRRVTILLISENGSVLWRRHRQLTYKQVTARHQSLFKHVLQRPHEVTRLNISRLPEGVNAKM